MVNEEKVRQLAAHLRSRDSVNMRSYVHECGTPSCIAGHAAALFQPQHLGVRTDARIYRTVLSTELGLSERQLRAIVYMDDTADDGVWARVLGDQCDEYVSLRRPVTPDQAADALLQICGVTP